MTMLDRMRRHKNWLKWSLAIVVLAFVFLYIPSFVPQEGGASDVVASVDGREITVARFRRVYQQQMQAYRNAYGDMDERLLRQLGIDQRILQGLIEEEAAIVEANRLGITASDEEVVGRIRSLPVFQEGGQFVGETRYRQVLQMQNPPIRSDEFEEQVRRGVLMEKLQGALTDWITVSDAEIDAEFRRRNETVRLAVVNFPADKYREATTATDEEVAARFDSHKDEYRIPEKRKVKFALIDAQAMRGTIQVSPQDVEQHYQANQTQFSTPEQVRASHILFRTEGKDEAEVRKRAEAVLKQARADQNFAKLAAQHTEEEAGKARGGDLDFFGRGQMAKEFEEAAFALKPGEVSDIVSTQFGLHILRLTERREAATRSLDEVRSQIEDQLKSERAQNAAQSLADELDKGIDDPGDLETVARARGLTVNESEFFARQEPISGLGMAPAVTEQVFAMKEGEVSDAIRTPQGFAFVTVTGIQPERVPELDEVRSRVRDDVVRGKAVETARQQAAAVAPKLKSGKFEAAAKAAGLEVRTTESIARGAPIPDVGVSPAVEAAAFSMAAGEVSDPIQTDSGAAIVRVIDRKEVTPEGIAEGRQALRGELLNERKNRFYATYMAKARENMRINQNSAVLAQVVA
ncbi:MAG: peptidyl-prolyl cis-trans isomerase [Acidobacteria bacterium]|nr:peptidyl-prolyl cis-trans isomerase [Acidobacteriota bacterium]